MPARIYEWRWKTRQFKLRDFDQPLWDGAEFSDKTLLLHAEQGLGDTLQFIRYASSVKNLGGRLVIECQSELVRLLGGVAGIDQVVCQGGPLPSFDLHAPFFSLLHMMESTLENIPGRNPYLQANPADLPVWRNRLARAGTERLKIGLVWAGSPTHKNDRQRSISPELLNPLLDAQGAEFFSLQKGSARAGLAQLGPTGVVADLTTHIGDFAETAAAVDCLDLVITVDTAVAHLAGGLGKPVWVLLPFAADWRWMLDRDDSPWYPTMRLIRQQERGAWEGVIKTVCQDLDELINSRNCFW